MWKFICILIFLSVCCNAGPVGQQRKNMPIKAREDSVMTQESEAEPQMQAGGNAAEAEAAPLVGTLTLPSNATSIRADITDSFSCANKSYGYYADVENDCQIFHVCLPVTYADGKENTFRWSFICPEETIFSQESFTCMRREDMTIDCEDSYRYYELNGNFGLPAEEEKQPAVAESEQVEQQKPQPEESEMSAAPEPPAVAVPEPVMEPVKPVKVQKPKPKPNRRKPSVTYNKPQRKVPVPTTAASVVVVRPNKEKPQAKKPAVSATATPIRTEIFNSIRKRPAIFNKHSTSSSSKPVQESEPAVTEAIQVQAELSEPQPTLKLQTMFVDEASVDIKEGPEPEAEASEPVLVTAQPEPEPQPEIVLQSETTKTEDAAEEVAPPKVHEEEMKPIETIKEIPDVIEEILEQKPQEGQQSEKQPEEQHVLQDTDQPESNHAVNEEQNEPAHAETSIVEHSSSSEDGLSGPEAMEVTNPADAPVSLPATSEMAEPSPPVEETLANSGNNNESKDSIGGFKPVDPAIAAEAEQLITDFLNTLRKHEEKTETELTNVAMDMAETIEQQPQTQESEDKLPLTDKQQETDNVSIEEAKLPEPEIIDKNASVEEQLLESEPEAQAQKKLKQDSPIINIMQLNHLPADYQIPVEVVNEPEPETVPESAAVSDQEAIKETAAELEIKPDETNNVEESSLVKAAYMPPISIDDIVELVKERLDQNPKNEQLTPMELILTPGAAAPMVLIPSKDTVMVETEQQPEAVPESAQVVQSESDSVPASEISSVAQPEQASAPASVTVTDLEPEQEEVILPIYKRVSIAEPTMSKVQTSPVTASKVEAEAKPEEEAIPSMTEVREAKSRSRMDARKRRFLFRADAS